MDLPGSPSWDEVKAARENYDYEKLCKICFKDCAIETILIDDYLADPSLVNEITWHDQFTRSKARRLIRVEIVAEVLFFPSFRFVAEWVEQIILRELLEPHLMTDTLNVVPILTGFTTKIRAALTAHAQDPAVAGFKSIVCYRTGLDVSMYSSQAGLKFSLLDVFKMLQAEGKVRLAHKDLNDLVVRTTLEVAGEYQKPGE
jgi:hypothetical protein